MDDTAESSMTHAKDFEGNTFFCRDLVFKGERLTYDPAMSFNNPLKLFQSLDKFAPRDDDIWLLSFGKSGTHWLNEILNILVSGQLTPAKDFKSEMMVEKMADICNYSNVQSPRIFNTHLRHKYIPNRVLEKSKLIYIIRNPKSVAVSWYYHMTGIKFYEYESTFASHLPTFIEGHYNMWGSWFDHTVEMWRTLKDKENALIITYEDLKKDGVTVVKKIADFLELDRTMEFCSGVAQLSSFEKMAQHAGKDPEQVNTQKSYWRGNKDNMFRKGTITDWKNTFTVAQNEHFDKVYNESMEKYQELKALIKFY